MFKSSNIGGLMRVFPWLKHICPNFIGYTNVKKAMEAVQDNVEESYQINSFHYGKKNVILVESCFLYQCS